MGHAAYTLFKMQKRNRNRIFISHIQKFLYAGQFLFLARFYTPSSCGSDESCFSPKARISDSLSWYEFVTSAASKSVDGSLPSSLMQQMAVKDIIEDGATIIRLKIATVDAW